MKIVHTADWHLGKRLENKLRLSEQEAALDELNELCDREKADIVIVAGDVFDTAVPSAEAEELFYKAAVKLAKNRPVVVIAGNHDDADRLAAPFAVAKTSGIYLIGGLDNTRIDTDVMTGGFGWLRFTGRGERLNLAALPFPSRSRMDKLFPGQYESYPEFAAALIAKCTECFDNTGINIFASHLFMDGCLMSDERPGNAVMLTKEVLPMAHYSALGHIHKPQCVSRSKNAFYSGSLLKYHFDESDDKEFIVYNSATKQVTHHPIKSGKKLVRLYASDFAGAMAELDKLSDCYAELIYESMVPLKPSEAEKIRDNGCLAKLTVINKSIKREVLKRREQTDAEIFDAYYKAVRGVSPSEETLKAFLEVVS
ncbi:MAG: exonuclease subunit SbcD [Clostridiales bacterium]|nr:exonuclease subunit SbcD [Clostridiales bacterium]